MRRQVRHFMSAAFQRLLDPSDAAPEAGLFKGINTFDMDRVRNPCFPDK